MKIDNLDEKILNELSINSRSSFREISRKLNVSIATVITRVSKLEKEGIIKHYTAYLDHEKLGYDITAIIEVLVEKGKVIEVEQRISKHKNVVSVYDITGEKDIVVVAKFKTRTELNRFIKTVLSAEYIERTNTHIVLNTVKEDFRLVK